MRITEIINSGYGAVQLVLQAQDLLEFANEIISQTMERKSADEVKYDSELMTREAVMQYLGIKATTLWTWNKKGILIPIKIRRKNYYRKSDILALQQTTK